MQSLLFHSPYELSQCCMCDIPQLRMDDIPVLLSEYGRLLST